MILLCDIYARAYAALWLLRNRCWCSCPRLAHEGSTIRVKSVGRGSHVEYWYLDIDVFSCNRLPIDLDDIITNLGDLVLGLVIKERTLDLLKRVVIPDWCFLRLHSQVGRND